MPPITLTTNGSVLHVPGNDNHAFISKSCNHLATLPLFQKLVMTTCCYNYLAIYLHAGSYAIVSEGLYD